MGREVHEERAGVERRSDIRAADGGMLKEFREADLCLYLLCRLHGGVSLWYGNG